MSCLEIEIRRMLKSRGLKVAIFIGILFVISHATIVWQYAKQNATVLGDEMRIPYSAFMFFMGYDMYGWQGEIYFRMMPLLATLPYANSYFIDISGGYIKNIVSRAEKKRYLVAKYIAIFTSGGIAVVVPLLVDMMMCTALLPSYLPRVGSGLFSGASVLYAQHPYLYLLLFLSIDFIFGGIYAVLALLVTDLIENKYLILIFPYMLMLIWNMLENILDIGIFLPVILSVPEGTHESALTYVVVIGGSLLITFGVHYLGGMRKDVL